MGEEPETIRLSILNRGWNRYGLSIPPITSEVDQAWALAQTSQRIFTTPLNRADTPWAILQWWESEWQAIEGIKAMCSRPFLDVGHMYAHDDPKFVPARMLYPFAFRTTEEERIGRSARFIAAMVRQAREFYTAADAAGVTDLSRPVLYFYGALALGRAVVAAVFGEDHVHANDGHGLTVSEGPSSRHAQASWPTIIKWKEKGEFVMLYRAARWDADLYRSSSEESTWQTLDRTLLPRLHILECIRWLGYPWGTLPLTGFESPAPHVPVRSDRERCLLLYRELSDTYLKRDTPPDARLYQAPPIVVYYILLYYFSILARYHGLEWQELLSAATEPEGAVFRAALEYIAGDFVAEITHLLPRPQDNTLRSFPWFEELPDLDSSYEHPVEHVGGFHLPSLDLEQMEEWHGP